MGLTLADAIERFRREGGDSEAAEVYISLLEGARSRWQSAVELHDWRLDILAFRKRGDGSQQVQVEFRKRDGEPILVFSLGPARHDGSHPGRDRRHLPAGNRAESP